MDRISDTEELIKKIDEAFDRMPTRSEGVYWLHADEWSAISANCKAGPLADIRAERERQVLVEGWTPEHDDEHNSGEMAIAAACYADFTGNTARRMWPWSEQWWKPIDRRRDLVKAGALIVAELERLDRAMLAASPDPLEEKP